MEFNPTKLMAFTCAVALGFAGAKTVIAQETVIATLTTSAGITTTDGVDMDFGTWMIQIDAGAPADDGIFTLVADTGITTLSGTQVSPATQIVNITAGAGAGTVLVQTPAASVLQMQRTAATAFADTNLSLTSVSYSTFTEAEVNLPALTNVPVTVLAAATDETVTFGAAITATDTPAASTAHTSSFDVTFTF